MEHVFNCQKLKVEKFPVKNISFRMFTVIYKINVKLDFFKIEQPFIGTSALKLVSPKYNQDI